MVAEHLLERLLRRGWIALQGALLQTESASAHGVLQPVR